MNKYARSSLFEIFLKKKILRFEVRNEAIKDCFTYNLVNEADIQEILTQNRDGKNEYVSQEPHLDRLLNP